MWKLSTLFHFLFGVVFASNSIAQGQDCGDLLKPDITSIQSSDHVRLSYLHSMTKEAFDKASHSAGLEGNILVDAVPLKLLGSYSDFRERLQKESDILRYDYNRERSLWYYTTRVPNERSEAFLDCVNGSNLRMRIADRTNDARLALKIAWTAPAGSAKTTAVVDFSQSSNIRQLPSRSAATFSDHASKTLVFQRLNPKVDMLIVANTGLFTATFRDPAPLLQSKLRPVCQVVLNVTLDDHNGSGSPYRLKVSVGPNQVFDARLAGRVPHGRPYGGPFVNWSDLPITATIDIGQPAPAITLALLDTPGGPDGDWLGLNAVSIVCPGRTARRELRDEFDYGPGKVPIRVIRGGKTSVVDLSWKE